MRYLNISTFVVVVFLVSFSEAQESCVVVQSKSKAVQSGKRKRRQKTIIFEDEIFSFVKESKNGKYLKVRLDKSLFWVRKKDVSDPSEDLCSPIQCVEVSSDFKAFDRPIAGRDVFPESGKYPVVSKTENFEGEWFRISSGDGFFWLGREDFDAGLSDCEIQDNANSQEDSDSQENTKALSPVEKPEETSESEKTSGWSYGIEAGFGVVSSNPIAGAVTPAPASNVDVNEDTFDSPFIDSVKDGSGFYIGAFIELPMFSSFFGRFTLGYSQRTLSQVVRENPHRDSPSFITYPELPQTTEEISFSSIYFSLFPSYPFELISVSWRIGVSLRGQYYLNQHSNEFRTAPQKLVPYFVQSGYEEFEFEVLPRLEAHFTSWVFAYLEFNNRVVPEVDFFFEPYLGIGFKL